MPVIASSNNSRTVVVTQATAASIVQNRPATVITDNARTAQSVTRAVATLAVSSPGVQGPAGQAGGTSDPRIASGAIGGHRLVRSLDATRVGYVDVADSTHGDDTLGLTLGAAADGEIVNVQRAGSVSFNGWSWTPGEPVFAGSNGLLTQTAPEGVAFTQVVGFAETDTALQLQIQPAIYF